MERFSLPESRKKFETEERRYPGDDRQKQERVGLSEQTATGELLGAIAAEIQSG